LFIPFILHANLFQLNAEINDFPQFLFKIIVKYYMVKSNIFFCIINLGAVQLLTNSRGIVVFSSTSADAGYSGYICLLQGWYNKFLASQYSSFVKFLSYTLLALVLDFIVINIPSKIVMDKGSFKNSNFILSNRLFFNNKY